MAIVLLLLIILLLVLAIPSVQTRLGNYATGKINDKHDTSISLKKLGLLPNGDVTISGVFIEDHKQDTLIAIPKLHTSIFSLKNIYQGKFTLGDIDMEGLMFNLKTYKGENDTNLDVFIAKFEENEPKKDKTQEFLLSSSDLTVLNGRFTLTDENKEKPLVLDFKDVNLNASNFVINGSDVSARFNTLSFVDSSGLVVENFTSNFTYSPEEMDFSRLQIVTGNSSLKGDLKFTYQQGDLKDFANKVQLDANFTEADIALNELNNFYNEFGYNQRARFSTKASGTLNNLRFDNLWLTTSRRSKIYGNLQFKDLFSQDDGDFQLYGNFANLSSNYTDLKAIMPNILGNAIPSSFEKLGDFIIVGKTTITPSNITADVEISTDLGLIDSNLEMTNVNNIDYASYTGNVILDEFNLGEFLNDPTLKTTSLNLNVDGKGFKKEAIDTKLKGNISSITYNNYTYNNVDVHGELKDRVFSGDLVTKDNNIDLEFSGLVDFSETVNKFDFVANVSHANLQVLNFVAKDSISEFKGVVDMKMNGTTIDDAVGSINFTNTEYLNENDTYVFDDFAITSTFKEGERVININSPDIIEGNLTGNFKFADLGKLLQNSVGSLYANYRPHELEDAQNVGFNFNIYNKIIEVFLPELELGTNTFIRGEMATDEKEFNLTFKSPEIKLYDYFAQNIELQVDNNNPLFNAFVEVDTITTKFYSFSNINLVNKTLNDTLFVRSEFRGGTNNEDAFNLSFYHTITPENESVVGFKKSDITFKNNTWQLNKDNDNHNKVVYDRDLKSLRLDSLAMEHNNEVVRLTGMLRDSTHKDLRLRFKDVDLAKITPDLDGLDLAGRLNGKLDLLQQNGVYLPNSTLTIDDMVLNGTNLGSFNAEVRGNESLTNYSVDVSIKDDINQTLKATGSIDVSDTASNIDVDLVFNAFQLSPINAFTEDILNNVRGDVTGKAKVVGNLKRPDINGNLVMHNAGLGVPYLNVDYDFKDNSTVTLRNQSIIFNTIDISDTVYGSKGVLGGFLSHNNFSDWAMDISINTPRLLVLNTEEDIESLYYGTGFLGGMATISGPVNQLHIDVEGRTERGSDFKIPIKDTESFGDNSYVHFLSPEEKYAKQEGKTLERKEITGLNLYFDLEITQDAQVELVMDKESGSTIKGRGEGALLIDINTNGKFNIFGDLAVFEGVYNFFYGGFVQKVFHVEPGGTLAWNGDPMKAEVNIKAIYSTQANPSPLLDTPITRSIPVDVGIQLTGDLEKPEPDFSFEFPNVSSSVRSELEYRLESKDDRDNQALYLLTTGSFARGISELNVSGTLTERLSGIISGIFSSGNDKFNFGVNVEAGQKRPEYESEDRLGLTLQTKITDRILVNGKLGVPIGGEEQTIVAGDVRIDFLLNKDGTLTAKVFNRENNIRNFGDEIGYTQGLGVGYNVDFDTFKELLQKIFKGKVTTTKTEEPNTEATKEEDETSLPEFVEFKDGE